MIKKILFFVFALIPFNLLSQENLPENEINLRCGSDELHKQMMQTDPLYAARMAAYEKLMKDNAELGRSIESPATYIIPVVVHVMHKGEPIGTGTNISDEVIYAKIKSLNEQYRKIPGSLGDGNGVDIGIEFALAVRSNLNACSNGITRFDMSAYPDYMNYGVQYDGSLGMNSNTLKNLSFWNSNLYYNIYVVSEIGEGSIAGFANYASGHGLPSDGAVVISSTFTSLSSATLSHEIGHGLNLFHTFEGDDDGNDCPGQANGCGSNYGDCCADIPPHVRSSYCNSTGLNGCDGNTSNEQFQYNYMNYGSCRNMFTTNQKSRMVTALTALRGSLLATNGNNRLVPLSTNIVPSFIVSSQSVCIGGTITFTDRTVCIPNTFLNDNIWPGLSFSWTLTNGATVLTSTLQNPSFTLTQPGLYNLTYTIANSAGPHTVTIPNAIFVYSQSIAGCIPNSSNVWNSNFTVNNVSFNTIANPTSTTHNDEYTDYTCSRSTAVTAGQLYPLTVSIKAGNNYSEVMEAYVDYNNNGVFETAELILQGSTPANTTAILTGNVAIPGTAIQNTLLRMRIIGEAGAMSAGKRTCVSNYYTCDVEDYGVFIMPSLSTAEFGVSGLTYFPNPVNDILNISASERIEKVQVHNLLGQLVHQAKELSPDISVDLSRYEKGIYLVLVFGENGQSTFKIVKE